jgi:hypothetical protein
VDNQLLFQEKILGDERTIAAWPDQFGQGGQKMKK